VACIFRSGGVVTQNNNTFALGGAGNGGTGGFNTALGVAPNGPNGQAGNILP